MDGQAQLLIDDLAPVVDLASYYEYESDHWHRYGLPGHHLLLVRYGRIDAVTDAGRFHADAGEMLCFRPAALNQYGHKGRLGYYQIHLSFAPPPRHLLTPSLGEVGLLPTTVRLGERLEPATARMQEAMQLVESRSPADRLRLRSCIFALLALIAEASPTRRRITVGDPWQEARRRLASRLDAELPLSEVAAELDLSVDHFSRRFRLRFGISPGRLRTQARLRLAAQLLRSGSAPVKSVARQVGIQDATAFTRLFRRHYGMPPSALVGSSDALEPTASLTGPVAGLVINRHLVAPQMPDDWPNQFKPRG